RVLRSVATDPDVIHVVDGDAVVGRGPNVIAIVHSGLTTPRIDEVTLGIELEDGRCGRTALTGRRVGRCAGLGALVQRGEAAMHDVDMVTGVHADADRRTENPVVRKRLG